MTLVVYVVVTALVATSLFFGIRYFVRAYIRYRDSRLIICPDTGAKPSMTERPAGLCIGGVIRPSSEDCRLRRE
jgi:hypothetical protein